jgi:DNA-binding IclR family transcriptional regulator
MPVAVKDLLAGKVEPTLRSDQRPALVLAHLRDHQDHAFTAGELAKHFETDHRTLRSVLARLHARGVVDKKGDYWFALSDEDAATKRAFLRTSRDLDERLGKEDPNDWPNVSQPDP